MSSPRRDLDKWRDAVLKHPEISDACRVLLLVLAESMTADLKVSVSRADLARKLNRSERRVGDRFREAIGEKPEKNPDQARRNRESRLLDRVVRGQKNTARSVYQGLMPDAVNRTHGGPVENQCQQDTYQPVENVDKCPVENRENRVPAPSLNSQQDTRGSCLIRTDPVCPPDDGKERRDDESAQPLEAAACLDVCDADLYNEPCREACRRLAQPHRKETA